MPGSPTPAPFYSPTHPEKSQFSSVTKSCAYSPLIVISHDSRNTGQQSPDPLPTGQVKTFPPTPARGPEEPLLNGPRTNPSDTDPPQPHSLQTRPGSCPSLNFSSGRETQSANPDPRLCLVLPEWVYQQHPDTTRGEAESRTIGAYRGPTLVI